MFKKLRMWLFDGNAIKEELRNELKASQKENLKDQMVFSVKMIPYIINGKVPIDDWYIGPYQTIADEDLFELSREIEDSSSRSEAFIKKFVKVSDFSNLSDKENSLIIKKAIQSLIEEIIKRPEMLKPLIENINALQLKSGD